MVERVVDGIPWRAMGGLATVVQASKLGGRVRGPSPRGRVIHRRRSPPTFESAKTSFLLLHDELYVKMTSATVQLTTSIPILAHIRSLFPHDVPGHLVWRIGRLYL